MTLIMAVRLGDDLAGNCAGVVRESCGNTIPPEGLTMLRAAGVLSWLLAAGFGPLCVPAMVSIARGDGVWYFLGFPTYGGAVFEDLGLPTTVPLLLGFLLVAVAEVVVGVLLWTARRAGLVLALVLLPIEFVFWIGFALPFGPVLGLARTVLVLLAMWRATQTRTAAD